MKNCACHVPSRHSFSCSSHSPWCHIYLDTQTSEPNRCPHPLATSGIVDSRSNIRCAVPHLLPFLSPPFPPSGIRETGRRSQPTGAYIDIKKSALLRRTDWSLPHTWDGWRFHDKVWPLFCVSHQKFSSFCVSCFTQSLGGRQSLAERFEICTDWARVVRKFGPNLAELVLTWAEPYLQFQQKTRGKNLPKPVYILWTLNGDS